MKHTSLLLLINLCLLSQICSAQRTVKSEHIRLRVTSIKVLEDTLFFQFQLSNHSLLRYHLNQIRCYTQDRFTPKRTAVQQTDIEPSDPLTLHPVDAQSNTTLIIPYPAFSVPDSKNLFLLFAESGSARALRLKLSGRRVRRMLRKY